MRFLLDANALINLLGGQPKLLKRVHRVSPLDVFLSAIVVHEVYFGAYKSRKAEANLALLDALQFETLAFSRNDAKQAGEIRAKLEASGTPIGPLDTLIAGQARARDLVLVTHNTREFSRVPGLHLEDWEA